MAFSFPPLLISAVFVLSFILHVCDAAAVQDSPRKRRDDIVQRDQSCNIAGNTDLYGFGVRLGIAIASGMSLCPFLMHPRYILPTINVLSRQYDVRGRDLIIIGC